MTSRISNSSYSVNCRNHVSFERSILEILPEEMVTEIMSRLPDARDLIVCSAAHSIFRSNLSQVKVVRFVCRLEEVLAQRSQAHLFRQIVTQTIKQFKKVEELHLRIQDDTDGSRGNEMKRHRVWLGSLPFIRKWVGQVKLTLKKLTIIDYGAQSFFHVSRLLEQLSISCKQLQTVEVRNMFLDFEKVRLMRKITKLHLVNVKVTPTALRHINRGMPALKALFVVKVVGLIEVEFNSKVLEALAIWLSVPVKSVKLDVEHVIQLHLGIAQPETLIVNAPGLKGLRMRIQPGFKPRVQLYNMKQVKHLVMGTFEVSTLMGVGSCTPFLERLFVDLSFSLSRNTDVSWKEVLPTVPIPPCFLNLKELSLGSGFWNMLEKQSAENRPFDFKFPVLTRLILRVIVEDVITTMALISEIVAATNTLRFLELYFQEDSKVDFSDFFKLKLKFPNVDLICSTWAKCPIV